MGISSRITAFLDAYKMWAPWLAASGAIATWITLVRGYRVTAIERQIRMQQEYDALFHSREIFWTNLRAFYKTFRAKNKHAPMDVASLIRAVGPPPGVWLGLRSIRLWPDRCADALNQDQRTLWMFASSVYPRRETRQGEVWRWNVLSSSRPARAKAFHSARGELAKFWNRWAMVIPRRRLRQGYLSASDLWCILAWLEIALVQWTDDRGPGKVWLFRLAGSSTWHRIKTLFGSH